MATIQAQTSKAGSYGGTHGNMGAFHGAYTGIAAVNDVLELGKIPRGTLIKRVVASSDMAAAVTVDLAVVAPDGTSTTLATALDVNAKASAKDIAPVEIGFDDVDLQATVKGAAVTAGKRVDVFVEYLTIGTK